jgi:hypothetical protein
MLTENASRRAIADLTRDRSVRLSSFVRGRSVQPVFVPRLSPPSLRLHRPPSLSLSPACVSCHSVRERSLPASRQRIGEQSPPAASGAGEAAARAEERTHIAHANMSADSCMILLSRVSLGACPRWLSTCDLFRSPCAAPLHLVIGSTHTHVPRVLSDRLPSTPVVTHRTSSCRLSGFHSAIRLPVQAVVGTS